MTSGHGRRPARLAAGRARALGLPTRGTTAPNRLRRVDRWLVHALGPLVAAAQDPLVVDLGYGGTPVTTVELADRLHAVRADARVLGLEIDPDRVAAAAPAARPPLLEFRRGGFELPGTRPTVVRAMNVLRQYDESAVGDAWLRMTRYGAVLIEGTCDEIGRRTTWLRIEHGAPVSLTLAAHLASLESPGTLAERLPKALISRNVRGEPVAGLLESMDRGWAAAAALSPFGPRQRWAAMATRVRQEGWVVLDGPSRWRLGELTVAWPQLEPRA